ncbi:hypothetical protein [Pseudomonas putida]|uniref:hypothetical protein n=1 Tax=Pseudomonas putida TaxID=303 RepID=UPI000BEF666F|nr:hypothetical protein [Pseudomonas putida]PEI10376.1 hypothetical protein CRM86_21750 [Pseudomonas putida]
MTTQPTKSETADARHPGIVYLAMWGGIESRPNTHSMMSGSVVKPLQIAYKFLAGEDAPEHEGHNLDIVIKRTMGRLDLLAITGVLDPG